MNEKQNLRLKRNVGLDYVHTFLSNMNMQSSIWVLYLAYCGLHLAQIGLLEGIYHATSIVCEIPSGAAADLWGRKRCMILSNLCIAVSCVIMLFSKSFGWFAVSFAVQALGNNLNSGSEEALVYDSMKCLGQEEHYMGVYGRLNVLIEVAQGLATVAGGVLAEFSYFWCYAACVVIAVLALLPVLGMAEPPQCSKAADTAGGSAKDAPAEGTPAQRTIWETVKHHFAVSACILQKDARIGKIIGFYSVVFAAHTLLFFYSQQYFADFGYNKVQISVIMLLVGGASCFGALASEKNVPAVWEKVPDTGDGYHCGGNSLLRIREGGRGCSGPYVCRICERGIVSDPVGLPERIDSVRTEGNLNLGRQHVFFHCHDCAVPARRSVCGPVGVKDGVAAARRHFTAVSFGSLLHRKRKLFKRSFLMYDEKSEVNIC